MDAAPFSFLVAIFTISGYLRLGTADPKAALKQYTPDWKSLDSRPLPNWYDEAKFGIFMHWGVFSVPSFGDEWFWYFWKTGIPSYVKFMQKNYPPGFTYADFAPKFTAEFYNPNEWADILKSSGAKYVVLTTKHHEGFCNWPTKFSFNWNAQEVGPKRDLVGDLAAAIRKHTDLHFGVYHSLFEWFNPMYLEDKKNGFNTNRFVDSKTMPELYELVKMYKPDIIWSDGASGPAEYWKSKEFIAWLYNSSPVKDTVVINDRWGSNCSCHHGGFYTCKDRYNPGKVLSHKWENCMTIDQYSWGYRREASLRDYMTIESLIKTLVETVSYGGNLLMNIGPTHDGRIVPIFEERLRQMGTWLGVNGEAIYSTQPWVYQNDSVTAGVWYTKTATNVYAITLTWPKSGCLVLSHPAPSPTTTVSLLGYGGAVQWAPSSPQPGITIQMPSMIALPWAWVFKLSGLSDIETLRFKSQTQQ